MSGHGAALLDRTMAGRVAIVSGAGEGIGRSVALALARDGADVALGARRPAQLERVAAEVRALGRRALCVPTDIGEEDQCRRLVAFTVGELGRLDAVVNVAALSVAEATVEDVSRSAWERALAVNLFGTMEVSRAAIAHLREAGGGAVVQISTLSTRTTPSRLAPYTSAKMALVGASQTMAREVGPDGVRVNVVVPGYVTGPHLDALFSDYAARRGVTVEKVAADAARLSALKRIPSPDDVAEAVLFLASPRSAGITGIELDVNGGVWG
jgi:NAD(P)-dependent dehydrogenase (short-subunit alcohol dehydrogenase family)